VFSPFGIVNLSVDLAQYILRALAFGGKSTGR
jgi:hypothetical protein